MDAVDALVRDLHRQALTAVLYGEATQLVVLHSEGVRSEHPLGPCDPDDHRIAHATRETVALVDEWEPEAAAVAVTLRSAPDPHEVLLVAAAAADGTQLVTAVHAIPTSDGILGLGPPAEIDPVSRALPEALVAALGRCA
jgi:hypothetical protein